MKQSIKVILIVVLSSILFSVNSCKSKQKTVYSNTHFYRTDARATSKNREASREKALFIAKQKITSIIRKDLATPSTKTDSSMLQKNIYHSLSSIKIIDEETQRIKGGKYKSYVAIEIPKTKVNILIKE